MHRLTITLPDELYSMARAYAVANRKSISKAVADLLRRRYPPPVPAVETSASSYFDPVLGIQVSRCDKPITMEDIQRASDDEDVRHLEMMGLRPEEMERSLNR